LVKFEKVYHVVDVMVVCDDARVAPLFVAEWLTRPDQALFPCNRQVCLEGKIQVKHAEMRRDLHI